MSCNKLHSGKDLLLAAELVSHCQLVSEDEPTLQVWYLQVSATSFNEGSSRSHTILRLSIESSERPDLEADPNCSVARTLSFLNLIDLAGSESAKAAVNKGHRTEGSYINKSLLTLGTVIAKLSDGNAAHIPFRDSKLTRLLQV